MLWETNTGNNGPEWLTREQAIALPVGTMFKDEDHNVLFTFFDRVRGQVLFLYWHVFSGEPTSLEGERDKFKVLPKGTQITLTQT